MPERSAKVTLSDGTVRAGSLGLTAPRTMDIVNLLLVDDRAEDLLALSSVLDEPGYCVLTARTSTDALRLLSEHDFAVIVLDVIMPEMDGFDLASLIKQRPRSRLTPIIFLTGEEVDIRRIYRAYSVGAIDYLQKPVDREVVRAKVAVFADLFRKEQTLTRQSLILQKAERRERELEVAELALKAQRRYQALAEAIPDIVWTADAAGELDYVNPRWAEYTGLDPERARGRGWLSAVHEADASECRRAFHEAVATATPFSVEFRLRRASDGRYRYHRCQGVPERDETGSVRAWAGIFTDFEDLKQAIGARDEFIALASHELRTPLTALKLRLQGMQRSLASDVAVATKLEGALRQTGRLERLIDNLLDVSRIAAQRLGVDPEEFALDEVVTQVAERFRTEADRAGISIELSLPKGCSGQWDRLRVEQMLSNLISNALRYRQGGPVRVDLRATENDVTLAVEGGSPIPDASLAKIFDRFAQSGTSRTHAGLGVGLYVTRKIAEAHGGSISVENPPERWPIFRVKLPRYTARAWSREPAPSTWEAPPPGTQA